MRSKHLFHRVADHARNTVASSSHRAPALSFLYPCLVTPLHTSSRQSLYQSEPLCNHQNYYSANTAQLLSTEELQQEPESPKFSFYRNSRLPPPAQAESSKASKSAETTLSRRSASPSVDESCADLEQLCSSPSSDPAHILRQCRQIMLSGTRNAQASDKIHSAVLRCSQYFVQRNELLLAARVMQDMLGTTERPQSVYIASLVSTHVDQLINSLTLHRSGSSIRATRGFASQQHYLATTNLLASMRASGISRSTSVQTAILRAMIQSQMALAAVRFFASELQAWWELGDTGQPSAQAVREIRRALTKLEQDLVTSAAITEYAQCLAVLSRLLALGRLPIPKGGTSPTDIVWIISASCRLDAIISAATLRETKGAKEAADTVRAHMTEYIETLPSGQDHRPALGLSSYNQLIHYTMAALHSATLCKHVFSHMVSIRQPPLVPDAVTYNTILRQATSGRYEALGRAVLAAEQQAPTATTAHGYDKPNNYMLEQADRAIANADSHRLVTLTQYITSTSLFLPRYRDERGHVRVTDWIMRLYPSLNKVRFSRRFRSRRHVGTSDESMRPAADRAGRLAILNPHVLTATLNLAAKAGKTGLALRIWRLLKRTSLQSCPRHKHNDVSEKQWSVPVQAATIIMQVLSKEATKFPDSRPNTRIASRFGIRRRRRNVVAHGWNVAASASRAARLQHKNNGSHPKRMGEGLRCVTARLVAQREYAFLLQHWDLNDTLEQHRTTAILTPSKTLIPDAKYFRVVCDLFGRANMLVNHAQSDTPFESKPSAKARFDPFLLIVVLDCHALGLPVPAPYRWMLELNSSESVH